MRGRTTEIRINEDMKRLLDDTRPLSHQIEALMTRAVTTDAFDNLPNFTTKTHVYVNQALYQSFLHKAKLLGFNTGIDYLHAILKEVGHEQ